MFVDSLSTVVMSSSPSPQSESSSSLLPEDDSLSPASIKLLAVADSDDFPPPPPPPCFPNGIPLPPPPPPAITKSIPLEVPEHSQQFSSNTETNKLTGSGCSGGGGSGGKNRGRHLNKEELNERWGLFALAFADVLISSILFACLLAYRHQKDTKNLKTPSVSWAIPGILSCNFLWFCASVKLYRSRSLTSRERRAWKIT